MKIWRINLKSAAKAGVNPREFCLNNGIVGVGWPIETAESEIDWQTYEEQAKLTYPNSQGFQRALKAFYHKMQIDDLVWTRDTKGEYYIGRITSDWRYDTSNECRNADIHNIRSCEWHKVGTVEKVPGKVVSSFIPRATVQAVSNTTVLNYSKIQYNKLSETPYYAAESQKVQDVFSLISDDDCEDLVALYLQYKRNYMVVPSTCKKSTANYEYVLVHKETGKSAVAQVKKGNTSLYASDFNDVDAKVYLFTTEGKYEGNFQDSIHILTKDEIEAFVYEHLPILPEKIRVWAEMTQQVFLA